MGLVFTPISLLKIKCCNATRQHPLPVTTKTWVLKQQASLADAMTLQANKSNDDKHKGTCIEYLNVNEVVSYVFKLAY